MENIPNSNYRLAEVASDFLLSLPPQDREKTQAEVYKFVRWLGPHRKTNDLSPVDVASYGELVTPPATKPVKSFLTYIRGREFTKVNLAPHLRAKRASSKLPSLLNSQAQITLTEEGYAKLEVELASLKIHRSDVIKELQKAAADKDFRENAPLDAAREQKARLEGRIKELESTLKSAKVMGEHQIASRIKIGDKVMLCELSSGKELNCILVDPKETNPAKGKISVASPIGKAILDKEKGQTVEVIAPAGIFSYRIEDIQPQERPQKSAINIAS